jgi:two-component sensor histidine kinase
MIAGKTSPVAGTMRSNLRVSSALTFGFSCILLAAGIIGIVFSNLVVQRMEDEVSARNQLLAVAIANDMATFLNGHRLALQLSSSEGFWTQVATETLSLMYPAFSSVLLVDASGQVEFASMSSRERFFDVSNRDFFLATRNSSQPYLSPTFIAEGDYAPTAVMAVPGRIGLAVAYLNLEAIGDYIKDLPVQGAETIAIVDHHGYYVAHRDARFIADRSSVALESWYRDHANLVAGSKRVQKPGEPERLICWAPVPGLYGWTVIVSEDTVSVFAQLRLLRAAAVVLVAGISLVAMAMILSILQAFNRDIRSLHSHTVEVAGGNYDSSFHYQGFKDLAPLANGYREAIVAVKEREQRIQENERRMAASLKEKEILLKEIHHRVKNNLQLIISLLNLKAQTSGMDDGAFIDSIDRVRVMATIHELLYESHDFSHIDLGEYIHTIVDWIMASYAYGPVIPQVALELSIIDLDIDSAIPCGLIINELLTNAIKYAFDPPVADATIRILTRVTQEGFVELVFADNGKGIPSGIDPDTVHSLGVQLIVALSSQLQGSWQLSRDGGTTWTIRFPWVHG